MSSWGVLALVGWLPLLMLDRQFRRRRAMRSRVDSQERRLDTYLRVSDKVEQMRTAFPVVYKFTLTAEAVSKQRAEAIYLAEPQDEAMWDDKVQLLQLLSVIDRVCIGVNAQIYDLQIFQRCVGPYLNISCERLGELIKICRELQPDRFEALLKVDAICRSLDNQRSAAVGQSQRPLDGKSVLTSRIRSAAAD